MYKQTSPVKWAGSKRRLLEQIDYYLPTLLKRGFVETYFEPFLGGGSVFYLVAQYYSFDRFILCDQNENIINLFTCIQKDWRKLIKFLNNIIGEYLTITNYQKENFYYEQRTIFNYLTLTPNTAYMKASLFIFLNKTAFNGLYRTNKKGFFNVPFGKKYNATISSFYDEHLIEQWHKLLNKKNVELHCLNYQDSFTLVNENHDVSVFAYCDPPYRPLTPTSKFTSYSRQGFNEKEQIRLAKWCCRLKEDWLFMVSNSNPKQINPEDLFFESIYPGFYINLLTTSRILSGKLEGRKPVTELLLTNYRTKIKNI